MPVGEKDMGPFVGMDADLQRAISAYGTPPYREMVRVEVRDESSYSFETLPTTIDGWIEWMQEARKDTPEEYRELLNVVLEYEHGYYDSGDSASLTVWYERPETDEEMIARVRRGIEYVRQNSARERATYEALKKKFESA